MPAPAQLSAGDLEERKRRQESWEENKEQFEQALKAPWERHSGRAEGGHSHVVGQHADPSGGALLAPHLES